ncbi:LysR family transcriptional regulator [Listeria marthii]|uniref:LysR family transcriptional regulator n=1 Tax=Listeria marthii TaxID=529731 RepID=UPI001889BC90|nr:LysR family transcriptional regulator [Listeria marthii]MBF2675010.1 LysR family transcriptional regulator [Listeria marthii]
MNLHHLRYFVTLAHMEHYTKAAEKLLITQPSLSHAISSLEQELGIALFEKEGRNIGLSKAGKVFLDYVEESLDMLDTGVATTKKAANGEGQIDLAFLQTLGTSLVPKLVQEFLQTEPEKNIDFVFHTGVSIDIIQGLKEKKFDIGICSKLENERNIHFTPIAKQELVLIVPKGHPLAEKDWIDLSETVDYPHIAFSKKSGLRPIIDELFRKIGADYKIAYEIEVDQVIAGMVAQNFGIAVVPNMPILNYIDVKVLPIRSPSWERSFYLAVVKNQTLTPAAEKFKQFMLQHRI